LLQIRGAVAEYERSLIAERMRRGRLSKYRAGVLLPWSRPLYGYRLDAEHPRDPRGVRLEPAQSAMAAEIFAAYLQDGASLLSVATQLLERSIPSPRGKKRWGVTTLSGMLTNPAYTGQVYALRWHCRPSRMRRSATHPVGRLSHSTTLNPPELWIPVATIPAIVTQEQFDQVQAKLIQNKSRAKRNNKSSQYLLRAMLSCGLCQWACAARTVPAGKHGYYRCTGRELAVQFRTAAARCPARGTPAQQLDELVWQDLCALMTDPESISQALERAHGGCGLPQELQARQENLRRGRASLDQQLNRLTEAYLAQVIPLAEYQRRRNELEQRTTALENQASQLRLQVDQRQVLAGLTASVTDFCQRVQRGLATATFEQKRQLVELLIDRVLVANDQVEIHYVIPTSPNGEHTRFCHLRTDYF
jgi:site-specific DNA recombinase